jgi:hypothetical protein
LGFARFYTIHFVNHSVRFEIAVFERALTSVLFTIVNHSVRFEIAIKQASKYKVMADSELTE